MAKTPGEHVRDNYILVVEDDEDIRENMVTLLEDEGYRTLSAQNGQEALDFLLNTSMPMPKLIVLDLYMPVMNGKTFLQELSVRREHQRDLDNITVLLLTASGESERKGLESETVGILRKPIDIEEFLALVKEHLA